MAQRTTTAAVQVILGANFGAVAGSTPSLQPYVDSATVMVDRVQTRAVQKGCSLTAAELELVERWLSAMFYCRMDPGYKQRSTDKKSGSFITPKNDEEYYRQTAIELDASGALNELLNRQTASAAWLGKVDADKVDAADRVTS